MGFGFVELESGEAAAAALAELEGSNLQGRTLRIRSAPPRRPTWEAREWPVRRLVPQVLLLAGAWGCGWVHTLAGLLKLLLCLAAAGTTMAGRPAARGAAPARASSARAATGAGSRTRCVWVAGCGHA